MAFVSQNRHGVGPRFEPTRAYDIFSKLPTLTSFHSLLKIQPVLMAQALYSFIGAKAGRYATAPRGNVEFIDWRIADCEKPGSVGWFCAVRRKVP
jgi:hypothetical protein